VIRHFLSWTLRRSQHNFTRCASYLADQCARNSSRRVRHRDRQSTPPLDRDSVVASTKVSLDTGASSSRTQNRSTNNLKANRASVPALLRRRPIAKYRYGVGTHNKSFRTTPANALAFADSKPTLTGKRTHQVSVYQTRTSSHSSTRPIMATATAVRSSPLPTSNKRKRGPSDQDGGRNVKAPNTNGDGVLGDASGFTAVHQMLQGIDHNGVTSGDDSTRTAQAALATPMQPSSYPEPGSFDGHGHGMGGAYDDGSQSSAQGGPGSTQQALYDARQNANKPAVGTAQWHQQRKDNHKEGEDSNDSWAMG